MGLHSIMKALHPLSRTFLGKDAKDGSAGLQWLGQQAGYRSSLDQEMKDYDKIPTMLRDKYTQFAQRAGTYGNTPEFQAGLNSEVQAGARGARVEAASRINALRRSLGMAEDFNPENYQASQGNATQEALRNSPTTPPTDNGTTTTSSASSDTNDATGATSGASEQTESATSSQKTAAPKKLKRL